MKKQHAKFNRNRYRLLSELGSGLNLSFSSHLEMGDKLIALDGVKKCLLVWEANNEFRQPYLIELNRVSDVSVKKNYSSIAAGELKLKGVETFLRTIDLYFEFRDNDKPVVFSFYDSQTSKLRDIPGLERNARNWQLILSRLIMTKQAKQERGQQSAVIL